MEVKWPRKCEYYRQHEIKAISFLLTLIWIQPVIRFTWSQRPFIDCLLVKTTHPWLDVSHFRSASKRIKLRVTIFVSKLQNYDMIPFDVYLFSMNKVAIKTGLGVVSRPRECCHKLGFLSPQLSQPVGSRMWLSGAPGQREGAAGCLHWSALQGHWERWGSGLWWGEVSLYFYVKFWSPHYKKDIMDVERVQWIT